MVDRRVVQWDKEDCADLGIIKIDLLGLGMLAALEDTLEQVRVHEGVTVDLARLPADDAATYAMIREADTIGTFQIESRAQMATLPRMKPERFYDLVVEVAIIRPGPITGRMVNPYLNRRAGREPVSYAHPSLEPILARTLGVPLFQEQLLRIAMTAAGFTGGEAEELRRAMGFKRSEERMSRDRGAARVAACASAASSGAAQEEILRGITSFALYGFPESHAASFALIAYASAYLKRHHPAAFLAGLLNAQPMGFYSAATLVKDAQRHGVVVLPIDAARSPWRCALERRPIDGLRSPRLAARTLARRTRVRLGLRLVSGLHRETADRLVAERAREPFAGVADFSRARAPAPRGARGARGARRAREPRSVRAHAPPGAVAGVGARARAAARARRARRRADVAAARDERARGDARRLPAQRRHDERAPDGAPARRAHRTRRALRGRAARRPRRTPRAHGRPRDRPPAPGHRQGLLLPDPRGRDRHGERRAHAALFPALPRRAARRRR